jgi:uncharacterized membrane protein
MTKRDKYNKENNLAATALKLLELIKVPVTRKFADDIKLRPEYPGLLAISNTLHELNVNNIVISISTDQLFEMSFPAIAQVRSNNSSFVIILKVENKVVHYLNAKLENVTISLNDFAKDWTGILLLAEKNEKSGEPGYAEKRKLEVLSISRYVVFTVLSVIILSTMVFLQPVSGWPILINSLGISLCIALLMQTLGQSNLLSNAACIPNSKIDCNEVVNSAVAKIYGDISLAEIGLLFFGGGLFTSILLTLAGHNLFNPYLFFLFVASQPFAIFSIYYQWKVIKTWCLLCLSVIVLLWAGASFYWFGYSTFYFDTRELIPVMVGYLSPITLWLLIRPSIFQAPSIALLRKSLYRFSKNQNVFDALLKQSQPISNGFGSVVVFGNPEAKHVITLVTSPTCGPCINAHHEVESWIDQFQENLKVVVRFVVNPNDNGSASNTVARNLISLALSGDYARVKEAMSKWYNTNRPELKEWLASLPAELHPHTEAHFTKHYEWCGENNITAVPAVFFNDKQIPGEFMFKDFENILRIKINDN